jgi:hypothetical protein
MGVMQRYQRRGDWESHCFTLGDWSGSPYSRDHEHECKSLGRASNISEAQAA